VTTVIPNVPSRRRYGYVVGSVGGCGRNPAIRTFSGITSEGTADRSVTRSMTVPGIAKLMHTPRPLPAATVDPKAIIWFFTDTEGIDVAGQPAPYDLGKG
jgi:hypothetical protein